MALVSLKEWAKKNGVSEVTARQKASRGGIPAFKIGRDWVIEENAENIDHRYGDLSRRWKEK